MTGQILSLTTSHIFIMCSLDVGFGGPDLADGIAFDKTGCFQ